MFLLLFVVGGVSTVKYVFVSLFSIYVVFGLWWGFASYLRRVGDFVVCEAFWGVIFVSECFCVGQVALDLVICFVGSLRVWVIIGGIVSLLLLFVFGLNLFFFGLFFVFVVICFFVYWSLLGCFSFLLFGYFRFSLVACFRSL